MPAMGRAFVRADFSYYPTIMSDDGKFLVSNGYVYRRIDNEDGTPFLNFDRPMYERLYKGQTFPHALPVFESHQACRDYLRDEALAIIAELEGGAEVEISNRFRNCMYDDKGIFFEMRQGAHYQRNRDEAYAVFEKMPTRRQQMNDEFPEVPANVRTKSFQAKKHGNATIDPNHPDPLDWTL
ncbi:TPA: hypothetical protein MBH56_005494 [Klebsiella pneumoniae]|nr:hypothetical protein [Klebsiella pneumoniae]